MKKKLKVSDVRTEMFKMGKSLNLEGFIDSKNLASELVDYTQGIMAKQYMSNQKKLSRLQK